MPVPTRAIEIADEAVHWRRHLHQIPELQFDLVKTAGFVAEKLRGFGCDEVVTGIAQTGIVATIRGRSGDGPTIGLRADMDALPTQERTGHAYASKTLERMHACGHDGHTAMLLGAAQYLAETRNFAGTIALLFQPAEEGGGGGRVMVDEGVMQRFHISRVFAVHNIPGIPVGGFAIRPGPIMAGGARFSIVVRGRGGHAALPHETIDAIVVSGQLIGALQTIASRSVNPIDTIALSVTKIQGGSAFNVLPESVEIGGTVRALQTHVAELAEKRIREICAGLALASGAEIDVDYKRIYPPTVNNADEARFAADAAAMIVGEAQVDRATAPLMAAEDFSFMLEARPGAFMFIGNGDTAGLHNPSYDFSDAAIPYGIGYFAALAESALKPGVPQ
jgi:hippurate hydrolase